MTRRTILIEHLLMDNANLLRDKSTPELLTANRIRELYNSKTYNREGSKPDWSHILPYYHEDIIFQDSIQRIEGIGISPRCVNA